MVLLKLISYFPLWLLYLFSDLLFFIGYHLIRYRRKVVFTNLTNSFPNTSISELRKIEKQFYRNLSDYAVETLKLLTMSEAEIKRRVTFRNIELAETFTKQGSSMIYITSHQFNWEWMFASFCLNTSPTVYYVYQKQSSDSMTKFLSQIRQRFGAKPIRRNKVAREVIRKKNTLFCIGILGDQFPTFDKRYWTTFLNQDTAFFQSINQLAVITQYPVIYYVCRRQRRGYYECELVKIAEPPYERDDCHIVDNYAKVCEKAIFEQPSGWLWSHNRWKQSRSEE